jgi:quinol-cytochrome oxidoreductase complex cytochrome b subunit
MILKTINLGIAFLLELCMLAALAYWGFQTGSSLPVKIVLGLGAPLIAILVWGRFLAPRSTTRLTGASYLVLKSVIFGLAAIGLATVGQVTLTVIFVVVSIVNQVLMFVWKQETQAQTIPE